LSTCQRLEEGRERGREEGRLELARSALARAVTQRLGDVPADLAARIAGCDDVDTLMGWLSSVVAAADADEVRTALLGADE
jgi:hypothetical protein